MNRWVIFDADNTLWEVESLYDNARKKLIAFVSEEFGADDKEVEKFQREEDRRLFPVYGYSACRFPQSFHNTVINFSPNLTSSTIRHVRKLASDVFEISAVPYPGTPELLERISCQFKIALITSGERWVQEKRIEDFSHKKLFSEIIVTEMKTEDTYKEFCINKNVDKSSSWMVGDSIRSDIIPGNNVGLNTILVRHNNWEIEYAGHKMPKNTKISNRIKDIGEHIFGDL